MQSKNSLENQLKIERARYQVALRAEAETRRVSPETSRIADRIARLEVELRQTVARPKQAKRHSTSKTAIARSIRDRDAMAMRAAGKQYHEIAEALGMANKSVAYKAVVRVLDQWQCETVESADMVRSIELQRCDDMLAALWPKALEGDPQAIDRIIKIMDRRARFLGLDATTKTDITTAGGPIDFKALSIEELEAIVSGSTPSRS